MTLHLETSFTAASNYFHASANFQPLLSPRDWRVQFSRFRVPERTLEAADGLAVTGHRGGPVSAVARKTKVEFFRLLAMRQ